MAGLPRFLYTALLIPSVGVGPVPAATDTRGEGDMKRGGVFIGVLCLVGSSFLSALTFPTASAQSDGWGTAELVEHHYAGNAVAPDVGIDAAGTATTVWTHTDGGRSDNRAGRFVAGVGWTPPVSIESGRSTS